MPRGLKGVVVADTTVGDVRGDEGYYHYRQYSAIELAETRPFEDVWRLMIDGALPATRDERRAFAAEVAVLRRLPAEVVGALPHIARAGEPLDGLRTALSLTASARGLRPSIDAGHAELRAGALLLGAVTPTLLCALHRLRAGEQPVEPRADLGHAANYLWMLTGREPTVERSRAIEQYLVATIDHGFNASTFTARVVASTGADLGACAVAAIGALSGPLHGGAPSRALALLDAIGDVGRVDEVVRSMIAGGEKIMGFGHPVYRTADPRSTMLRGVARRLATDAGSRDLVAFAEEVERRVLALFAELKPHHPIHTNVEFFAGVTMELCGVPRSMFTPTFAASRMIGWTANVLEQIAEAKIIRPSARYVGPSRQAVPAIGG